MIIHLPFPPSVNSIFTNAKYGNRRIKSQRYKDWIYHAGIEVNRQTRSMTYSGPYSVEISATRPDKRRRDIDNIIKPIIDLLVRMGKVADDSEMQSVTAGWSSAEGPGVKVSVFQHNTRKGVL